MTCKCRAEIEDMVLKAFIAESPDKENHKVNLEGYHLLSTKAEEGKPSEWVSRCAATVERKLTYKTKAGKPKDKVEKVSVFFSYCPFCGVKY